MIILMALAPFCLHHGATGLDQCCKAQESRQSRFLSATHRGGFGYENRVERNHVASTRDWG